MRRHWPLLVVLLLLGFSWRQSRELNARRVDLGSLRNELAGFASTNSTAAPAPILEALPAPGELANLRASGARVHQLRGEVTLAQQRQDNLTGMVARLAAQLAARTNQSSQTKPPDFPPGYRPLHELGDRGNATPEAAVETFWWAFTQGKMAKLQGLVLESDGQPTPPEDQVADDMKSLFSRFPGFRIVSQETGAGGHVRVGIETGPGGKVFHLLLVPSDNRWFVSMKDSDQF